MAKDSNSTATEREITEKVILVTQQGNESEKYVVCEVCGYANPEKTAMCKMCSNYLKGV